LLNICGQEDAHEMEVDSVTSVTQAPAKYPLPELEIYCYLLVLIFLIDQKKYNEVKQHIITERLYVLFSSSEITTSSSQQNCAAISQAKTCSSASIARLKNLNRRTVDVLASRLYSYYSLSYELTGDLAEIRG